jgi:hypothetical protein
VADFVKCAERDELLACSIAQFVDLVLLAVDGHDCQIASGPRSASAINYTDLT